jgi:O-acetyl-ADP-ribose deacetylase
MKEARIKILQGDITKIVADAIVNAANTSLLGGGGVDGAIHRAAGPALLAECRLVRNRQGGCKVGEAVITGAGRLPARFVIHTVGPVFQDGMHGEDALLESAYLNSLRLASAHGLASVAFPNISTGIYKFPRDRAARIAMATVKRFLEEDAVVQEVIFVCFDLENMIIYEGLWDEISL